ncbi:MAG: cation diffusion facilitator family transporter [Eubacteriaceae bacterium]|nr:cation diffusion facilitator family transporter [Eubacteriaceae bacterium]
MTKLLIKLFIKDKDNTEDPKVREEYGKFAGVVGILTNVLLCGLKIVIGLLSSSIAIVADGINNLSDASSSVITLVGFRLAGKPEDDEHPYGHARIEYLTGLIISIIIILVGALLLKTSVEKIIEPEAMAVTWATITVLAVAILLKIWQNIFYMNIAKKIDSLTLKATATDSRNDVIATSVVLVGVGITKFTGVNLDGWLGCLVAVFIIFSGIQLIKETSSPLLGEAPDEQLVRRIVKMAGNHEGVLGIHDLVVHNYGAGKIFASMHVEVDAEGDLMDSHDMIDNIEREIRDALHIEFVVHMDPVKVNDPLVKEMRIKLTQTLSRIKGVRELHDLRIVPGPTHTNIIFDLVVEHDCEKTDEEIQQIAEAAAKAVDPSYYVVITFDKAYTSLS